MIEFTIKLIEFLIANPMFVLYVGLFTAAKLLGIYTGIKLAKYLKK